MKFILLGLFLVIFRVETTFGQSEIGTTQNPASLRFRQINSPHFKIIYPTGQDSLGNQLASQMEAVYQPVSASLGRSPRKISLVLQAKNTEANGFVTLFPRRTEFFATPPSNTFLSGTMPWINLLAIHEYRHVVQYEKGLSGFTKGMYFLFGNNGLAIANLGIPDWFVEGDAVCAETDFTESGRGRIPYFDLLYRTQLLSLKKPFSYQKAVTSSFKDAVPDWYVLGYHLSSQARISGGKDIWGKVLTDYHKFPFLPFGFSGAVKKNTGLRVEDLYDTTNKALIAKWKNDTQVSENQHIHHKKNKVFTNYTLPQFLPNGKLLALKSGLADISTFVILGDSTEEKIHETGILNNAEVLSMGGNLVVWAEKHFDPRWGMKTYSVLKSMDVTFKNIAQITSKTRLFAPSISADGSKIAAIETDDNGTTQIILLNGFTGERLKTFPTKGLCQQPRIQPDGNSLIYLLTTEKGREVIELDLITGNETVLLNPVKSNVSQPFRYQNWLFYIASLEGINQIFARNIPSQKDYQVTNQKFGAYHPAVSLDGRWLAFQDFTPNGFRISKQKLTPENWIIADGQHFAETKPFGNLPEKKVLTGLSPTTFPSKKYSKANILNIYGWGGLLNSSGNALTLGIKSQDLLSTTGISAGYRYNVTENRGAYFANVSYAGWYPIIDLGIESAERATTLAIDRQNPIDSIRTDNWRQNALNLGIRLPFNFTHSKFFENLTVSGQVNLIHPKGYELPFRFLGEPGGQNITATTFQLSYSRLKRTAKRDLQPRSGQIVNVFTKNTVAGTLTANLLIAQGRIFLRGFGKHDGFQVYAGQQWQGKDDTYLFGSTVFFPRGHSYSVFDKLTTGSVSYRVPLLYPDFAIGRWLNFQRVKATLFADAAAASVEIIRNNQRQVIRPDFQTVGLDLTTDFNILRLRTTFDAGVRMMYSSTQGFLFQPLVIDIGF